MIEIDDKLKTDFAFLLQSKPEKIAPELVLGSEADGTTWDSMAIVSTIALADERFGVVLDGAALAKCGTLAAVLALIEKELARK